MRPRRRSWRGLHAHRARQLAAEDVDLVATTETGEGRATERLLLDDLDRVPRADPAGVEVTEHLGVGVGDPHERPAVAGAQHVERIGPRLDDSTVVRRDRIAVRVVRRLTELRG